MSYQEDPNERWFDGDYSECYYGWGHQDKAEFAAWVGAQEEEADQGARELEFTAEAVEHLWAVIVDDERFNILKIPPQNPIEAAFPSVPITRWKP